MSHRTLVARLQEAAAWSDLPPKNARANITRRPRAFSIAVSGKLSAGLPFR